MEPEAEVIFSAKIKDKTRRRSSIFSLLRRQKKLTRQFSVPTEMSTRKYSDSAILNHLNKNLNGDAKSTSDLSHFGG